MGARIFLNQRNFFCTKFLDNPSGHGRPRRKSWTSTPKRVFSCGPGDGEKVFDPWSYGVRVRNDRGKSGPEKFMFMSFFFPVSATSLFTASLVTLPFKHKVMFHGGGFCKVSLFQEFSRETYQIQKSSRQNVEWISVKFPWGL